MDLTSNRGRVAGLIFSLTLLAAGTSVLAQSAMDQTKMATLICRPALASETANATMTKSSTQLVCEPFAVSMHMSDGSMKTIGSATAKASAGPDFSGALTAQQANAAYNKWVMQTFSINHTP